MGLIGRTLFLEITSSAVLGTVLFTFVVFLQRVSRLFEQLVRGSASPDTVGVLFLMLLPPVLTFTIPVGVLVGTLMALSRMSADTEITALRARFDAEANIRLAHRQGGTDPASILRADATDRPDILPAGLRGQVAPEARTADRGTTRRLEPSLRSRTG